MPLHPHRPAQRLALLVGYMLLAGCSAMPKSGNSLATSSLPVMHTPPVIAPELALPPEWLTIESTVVSLGEQDLFDRMRIGFALDDVTANSRKPGLPTTRRI